MSPLDSVIQKSNTVLIQDTRAYHRRSDSFKNSEWSASALQLDEDKITFSKDFTKSNDSINSNSNSGSTIKSKDTTSKKTLDGKNLEEPQVQQEILRLKQVEVKVKAHEAAHKSVGGNLASSATYSYTQGPDGKNYITGGEVQIDISEGQTPEETISRMQQVIRAALAPADPSGQDRAVAAEAANRMAQAQQEKLQTSNQANSNSDAIYTASQTVQKAYNINNSESESQSVYSQWA